MATATKAAGDLDAFADDVAKRKSGPRCWVCSLKERAWVEKAHRDGRTFSVIRETLVKACGHPSDMVTRARIQHHLREHVREAD